MSLNAGPVRPVINDVGLEIKPSFCLFREVEIKAIAPRDVKYQVANRHAPTGEIDSTKDMSASNNIIIRQNTAL